VDVLAPRHTAERITTDHGAIAAAERLATEFAEGAAERDQDRVLPVAEIEAFSRSGLWGITIPAQHGGADVSAVTLARVIAIVSAADPSIGQIPQNHFATLERLRLHGDEEQKRFFFAEVLAGARLGNAASEPGDRPPGSHATRLRRTVGGYVLSGKKVYCTGALFAHWVTVSCVDEQGSPWTAYVRRGADGLCVMDDWSGFGQRTTASGTVILSDVFVSEGHAVRTRFKGPSRDSAAPVTHIIHAAIDLGIAQEALTDAVRFLRTLSHPARGSGVERATEDPLTLQDIGSLTVQLHAAELLVERAGRLTDRARTTGATGDAVRALVAVTESKIATTDVSLAAASKLFELAGTQSTLTTHSLDRHWRNARTHTLHDGVRWKYHAIGNYVLNGRVADSWTLGHPYSELQPEEPPHA
jgi:SfnB family sulfur acquisition oxidoreductase